MSNLYSFLAYKSGRQNMLWPYLKIWDWDWIFGHAVKAISSLGVHSLWVAAHLKVVNRNIYRLVQSPRIFKLLLKNKIYAYLLWPFKEKMVFASVAWCAAPNYSDLNPICHFAVIIRHYQFFFKCVFFETVSVIVFLICLSS